MNKAAAKGKSMKFQPEWSRRLRLLLLAGVALILVPSGAFTQEPAGENEAALRRLSEGLLCQCGGCTTSIQHCPHQLTCATRTNIRKVIQKSLAAGMSEEVILANFVEEYGTKILPEPPRQGFGIVAWVMPFFALVLGGAVVSYALWRLKKGSGANREPSTMAPGAAPPQEPASLVDKYRARIDRELDADSR
jgi:cytochrome c-type biogenesis protein CcmH